jgi:hypothetical protein
MSAWRRVQAEARLFRSRGAQALIPTILTLVVSGLSLTLIAIVIARSPYTHSNLSPAGYNRTQIIYVGDTLPYPGISLADASLAHTRDAVSDGRLLFIQYGCASCHGLRGQGQAVGKDISDASPLKITNKVREGPKTMPAFPPEVLPDADIEKLVAFLRSNQK